MYQLAATNQSDNHLCICTYVGITKKIHNILETAADCLIWKVLFLIAGTLFNVWIVGLFWHRLNYNVKIILSPIPPGISQVIIGYERHDLGVTLQGKYANIQRHTNRVLSSLVPGAEYTVIVLGLGGTSRNRNITRMSFRAKPASTCI